MMRWSLVLLPLVLFGCDGGDDEDTDTTPTPTPVPTDTADDTGGGGGGFVPAAFAAFGEFAINDQGQAVGYTGQDQTGATVQAPAVVTVLVVDDSVLNGSPVNSANSCTVSFGGDGPFDSAAWADTVGIYWGLTMPAGTPVVTDTCQDLEFPSTWGGDPASVLAQWDWGVGLAEMDPAIEAQLPGVFGAQWAVVEPAVIGGGWYSNAVFGLEASGYLDGGYAFAQEVDVDFNAQFDGAGAPILLDSGDVWFAGAAQPAVGAYVAQGVAIVQPADLLIPGPQ